MNAVGIPPLREREIKTKAIEWKSYVVTRNLRILVELCCDNLRVEAQLIPLTWESPMHNSPDMRSTFSVIPL